MAPMMRKCPHCGVPMPPSARFCGECGSALPEETVGVDEAYENAKMPVICDAPAGEGTTVRVATSGLDHTRRKFSKGRIAAIGGIAGAVVLAAGVAVALLSTGFFDPRGLVIDETAFPDESIRAAVMAQVDLDGDGELSEEEQQAVTGFVAGNGQVAFALNGAEVDPGAMIGSDAGDAIDDGAVESDAAAGNEAAPEEDVSPGEETDSGEGAFSEADSGDDSGTAGSQGGNPIDTGSLGTFPNLRTIVVRDAGLIELDLSSCSNVEYVDCRNNPLVSLNLAHNANLTTLFCDDDVSLEGLEEAGLYFTDLVVGATQANRDTGNIEGSWAVEYDTFGRPLKVTEGRGGERLYEYDDQGRLVRSAWNSSDWETYEYGENGLLQRCETFFTLDSASTNTWETMYGYSEDAALMQTALRYGGDIQQRRSFSHGDGRPTSLFSENLDANGSERGAFGFDDGGRLVAAHFYAEESGFQELSDDLTYEYDEHGMLVYGNVTRLWDSEYGGTDRHTEYDEQGHPLYSKLVPGNPQASCVDFDYSCNIDGYVTWVQTYKPDYDRDIQLDVSYIKMVGSLDDRPARRYVPQFFVGFGSDDYLIVGSGCTMGQEWGQDTASTLDVTVREIGPAQAAYQAMGIMPRTLSNPNELKLAVYDAEHWTDGLSLNGPSLIFEEQTEDVGLESEESTASYDIDTGDFKLNLPEDWKDNVDIIYPGVGGGENSYVEVKLKNVPEVTLLAFSAGEFVVGDPGEFDIVLAYWPLDDGRFLSVVSPAWGAILMDAIENDYQASNGLSTQGHWQMLLQLCLGDGSAYDEIATTPYDATYIDFLMEAQRHHLEQEIVSNIVIA